MIWLFSPDFMLDTSEIKSIRIAGRRTKQRSEKREEKGKHECCNFFCFSTTYSQSTTSASLNPSKKTNIGIDPNYLVGFSFSFGLLIS
uniref:Uncharacterized protein n=2 Tax=Arabidopsis thaliana TaxID=3702 RepID=Q1G397_ARATH|nr:unknown protein [Arabidopsis thaliana]